MKQEFTKKYRILIKSHFLKYQTYKSLFYTNLNDLTVELKQSLKIIYLFNKKKKKIVFIGFPFSPILTNQVNQIFISKKFYKKQLFNYSPKKYVKKPDLIVFYKTKSEDLNILKQLKSVNIPLILFGGSEKQCLKSSTLNTTKIKKFYFFCVWSVLNKSN